MDIAISIALAIGIFWLLGSRAPQKSSVVTQSAQEGNTSQGPILQQPAFGVATEGPGLHPASPSASTVPIPAPTQTSGANHINQSPLVPDSQGLIHPVVGQAPATFSGSNFYGLGNGVSLRVSIDNGAAWWTDQSGNPLPQYIPTDADKQVLRFSGVAI